MERDVVPNRALEAAVVGFRAVRLRLRDRLLTLPTSSSSGGHACQEEDGVGGGSTKSTRKKHRAGVRRAAAVVVLVVQEASEAPAMMTIMGEAVGGRDSGGVRGLPLPLPKRRTSR